MPNPKNISSTEPVATPVWLLALATIFVSFLLMRACSNQDSVSINEARKNFSMQHQELLPQAPDTVRQTTEEKLQQRISELETQLQAIQAQLQQANSKNSELSDTAKTLGEENEQLMAAWRYCNEEVAALQQQIEFRRPAPPTRP